MTMDNKTATEGIEFDNENELDKKWAEETAKRKIVAESVIKVATTEEGETLISVRISREMILPIMEAINDVDTAAFASAAATISLKNLLKSVTEDADDSEDGETPECK